MSTIASDVLTNLALLQSQVWHLVSQTVGDSVGQPITFATPSTAATKVTDLYAEFTNPVIVVQFAFSQMPDNAQVVLVPEETVAGLLGYMRGTQTGFVDENSASELRPLLEGIVQGICLAVGQFKNDTVVASGLSIRYQVFSFPPNLQRCEELARIQVSIQSENMEGTAHWLMDTEVAHMVLGLSAHDEEAVIPFPQVQTGGHGHERTFHPMEDQSGLEMLMDIPLEISVELGRVKMLVKEVVELGTGSIVELDKAAGEPVDVMVNGRLVARGEVVVIEDNFGVRITEILNPSERVGHLRDAA